MVGPDGETVLVAGSLVAGLIAVAVLLRIFWASVQGLVRDELDAIRADRAEASCPVAAASHHPRHGDLTQGRTR